MVEATMTQLLTTINEVAYCYDNKGVSYDIGDMGINDRGFFIIFKVYG
jgi:hypothetical protein